MDIPSIPPPIVPSSVSTSPSPPPVIPPQPPIISPQPPQKKSFVWLIVPLLIFVLTIGGYLFFQTNKFKQQLNQPAGPSPVVVLPSSSPNLTADWQTYTNKLFNFSFKYPSTFVITDNLQTSTDPSAWTTKKSLNLVDSVQNYSFSIMINPDGFGPWFPNKLHKLSYSETKGIYITDTSINNENLTPDQYSVIGSGSFQVSNVVGFLVFANSSDNVQAHTYLDKTFSQILATFKFTN